MAVAGTALIVALGGTSYAAVSITSKDIKDNSVTTRDVKNRSLKAIDFRKGQLPRGRTGPAGPAGAGRWALVNAAGVIEAQSGGFTVASGYVANPAGAAGNVYINANEPLTNNGIVATIALQNKLDQNGDTLANGRAPAADGNPEFSGEISATMCAIPNVVACAPPGTDTTSHLVVSPRLSDGQVTDEGTRKRFYVIVTGDSTDLVTPATR